MVVFWEKFADFDFEDFGEIHHGAVVHEDEAGLDFRDATAVANSGEILPWKNPASNSVPHVDDLAYPPPNLHPYPKF